MGFDKPFKPLLPPVGCPSKNGMVLQTAERRQRSRPGRNVTSQVHLHGRIHDIHFAIPGQDYLRLTAGVNMSHVGPPHFDNAFE